VAIGPPPRIWLVTDPAFSDEIILTCVDRASGALPRGALGVQLRDKTTRHPSSLRQLGLALRAATARHGGWLVVNGRPALARDVGAEGVHLGQDGGTVAAARAVFRRAWVSAAAHSDAQARAAADQGADAVLVSPIFPTRSPSAGAAPKQPRGLDAIRAARAAVGPRVQIYALGGVTPENAGRCAGAGADGVAVLRALLASPRPGVVARAIHDALPRRW
jgi:thiamine-phosphate diphosphorylase